MSKTVTYEDKLPTDLKLGRNKVIKNGKVIRIDVKKIKIYIMGKFGEFEEKFKITEYSR